MTERLSISTDNDDSGGPREDAADVAWLRRITLLKLWVVIGCVAVLVTFFLVFVLAVDQPLRVDQRSVVYFLMSLLGAALLCGILDSSGKIEGSLLGTMLTLGGAAAVSCTLLYVLVVVVNPRLIGTLPQAVVYTLHPDPDTLSFTAARIQMDAAELQHGSRVLEHETKEGENPSFTVVYGPTATVVRVTISTIEGRRDFTLHRDDEQVRRTRLLMPSGNVEAR